ncbi:hypothetical protein [Brevibacillus sp. 179-C9.3 HS]|uniref:hypothetical protein n=1 Tax=unclassified Brevibacillus TaxID=2684853 RepID=UPI0039A2022B
MRPCLVGNPFAVYNMPFPTEWESWYKDGKKVVAPFDEHAVLLVGYDETYAYVNDPLTGIKQRRVPPYLHENELGSTG